MLYYYFQGNMLHGIISLAIAYTFFTCTNFYGVFDINDKNNEANAFKIKCNHQLELQKNKDTTEIDQIACPSKEKAEFENKNKIAVISKKMNIDDDMTSYDES